MTEPMDHVMEDSITLEPPIQSVPPAKAPELLGRAAALMYERGQTYDKPDGERSMGRIIEAFNAITGRDLNEQEGWLLMMLLKAVRAFTRTERHNDSLDDLIAYAALLAESWENELCRLQP